MKCKLASATTPSQCHFNIRNEYDEATVTTLPVDRESTMGGGIHKCAQGLTCAHGIEGLWDGPRLTLARTEVSACLRTCVCRPTG
jgi:hypothetical protein